MIVVFTCIASFISTTSRGLPIPPSSRSALAAQMMTNNDDKRFMADDLLLDTVHEAACRQQTFEKLAAPSSMPLLPNGRRLIIGLGSLADCDTGGRVWSSASVLCKWLDSQGDQLRGRALLELGCGTGAVGLYAAALGAKRVTLTDGGSDALLALANANIRANCDLWEGGTGAEVHVKGHVWGEAPPDRSSPDGGLFRGHDWIVGSDVTYAVHAHDALCRSIRDQLGQYSPGARVVLGHQHRFDLSGGGGGAMAPDERLESFEAAAAAHGLSVATLLTENVDAEGLRRVSLLQVHHSGSARR